jgi:dTDP-3-amino-3,4,6-trideoxy-alpha-D-glucose transaminase
MSATRIEDRSASEQPSRDVGAGASAACADPAQQIPLTLMDHCDPELFCELMAAVQAVARTGAFIGGPAVEEFETDYAAWCEAPYAIGVSSGTEALALALRALGIGAGDEVVVPANSFVATAEAVSLAGARPRFADVDARTQLVTAATLERALTPRVRCLVPVHLYGRTVEMGPVMQLARDRRLLVLEDAAQAHGARYRGQRVGTIGDAGAFSFYPAKNLGAWGDAGAVVTTRGDVAERVRLLRSHGESPRYHHRAIGTTARLDAIQAAVLRTKLARAERCNESRRRLARRLREVIGDEAPVTLPAPVSRDGDHVYHQFVVRSRRRERLRELLAQRGVATGVHYPIPIHRCEAYGGELGAVDPAPCASALAQEILSLPIFPAMTDEQAERVGVAVRECAAELDRTTVAATDG